MRIKVAIITTEFLRKFIDEAMRKLDPGFAYTIYSYANFMELPDLYRSIPDNVQGVITSGAFPTKIIDKAFPGTHRVLRTFNNDDGDLYKLFLTLLREHPGLRLNRIYADPVEVLGVSLEEYITTENDTSFTQRVERLLASSTLETLIEQENYYRDRHLRLWEEGSIDVSITRFSSIISTLRDAGLRSYFAYPGLVYMRLVCHDTLQAIRLRNLHDNQAAVFLVTPGKTDAPVEHKRRADLLHKALLRFNGLSSHDLVPRATPHGFELLTDRKAVVSLTDSFTTCGIRTALREQVDFPFIVGYGLGDTIYQARKNAMDAHREAALSPGGESRLVNERGELIGPLHNGTRLVVSRDISPEVRHLSRRSGLSYITVQKISAALRSMKDNSISARELAEKLSITPRSANRFLSTLHEAGLARIVDVRRGTTRGRPERVYTITPDGLE